MGWIGYDRSSARRFQHGQIIVRVTKRKAFDRAVPTTFIERDDLAQPIRLAGAERQGQEPPALLGEQRFASSAKRNCCNCTSLPDQRPGSEKSRCLARAEAARSRPVRLETSSALQSEKSGKAAAQGIGHGRQHRQQRIMGSLCFWVADMGRQDAGPIFDNGFAMVKTEGGPQGCHFGRRLAGSKNKRNVLLLDFFQRRKRCLPGIISMVEQCSVQIGKNDDPLLTCHPFQPLNCLWNSSVRYALPRFLTNGQSCSGNATVHCLWFSAAMSSCVALAFMIIGKNSRRLDLHLGPVLDEGGHLNDCHGRKFRPMTRR